MMRALDYKMDEDIAKKKKINLLSHLKKLNSLLIAFSGGIDSTFLLFLAHQTLGENVMAVTSNSIIHPIRETENARTFAHEKGVQHVVFESNEMSLPAFVSNDADRCYWCKQHMFQALSKIADENGIKNIFHGANLDDLKDFRPGLRAANEAGVIAPLINAQLTKREIRFLSKEMGLSTWNKPSMSCLATRIPYGSPITKDKLKMVEDAEAFLLEQGFSSVRVRHHDSVARIEINSRELKNIIAENLKKAIVDKFRELGFQHIALDLEGYISGKTNRSLTQNLKGNNK